MSRGFLAYFLTVSENIVSTEDVLLYVNGMDVKMRKLKEKITMLPKHKTSFFSYICKYRGNKHNHN